MILQRTLDETRRALSADREQALRAAGLASGLALFGLRLLTALRDHDDPDAVADLLAEPAIRPYRDPIRQALRGDLTAALRAMAPAAPLAAACQALLNWLDGSAATRQAAAISISRQASGGTISHAPVTVAQRVDQLVVTAPDPERQAQAQALLAYLHRTLADCNASHLILRIMSCYSPAPPPGRP